MLSVISNPPVELAEFRGAWRPLASSSPIPDTHADTRLLLGLYLPVEIEGVSSSERRQSKKN